MLFSNKVYTAFIKTKNNKNKKETKNLNEKIKTTTDNHLHIEKIFSCFILFISKLLQHYFISMLCYFVFEIT